jgi:predicted transposase/invertase (TIGR01784 family)
VRQTSLLDPKLDLVFRLLFGNPENERLLVSLLNAILRPESPIESVTVLNPELEREAVEDKGIVLDVRVELADGRQIDVEMQSQPRPARRERALYYWARMYGAELGRGDDYRKLRPAVVIWIVSFNELEGARFHSTFRVREDHDGEVLSPQFELHVIELSKLKLAILRNEEPELARWGKFLTASTDEELETLAMSDPVFRGAKQALERLSDDPHARVQAEQREMALLWHRVELNVSREEGRLESLRSVLCRQLAAKFGAPPEALLARIAVAEEATLLRWLDRIIKADSLAAVFEHQR